MGKWPEVAGLLVGAVAGQSEAGQVFARIDSHQKEVFVIGEDGIVARFVLLDELPFE